MSRANVNLVLPTVDSKSLGHGQLARHKAIDLGLGIGRERGVRFEVKLPADYPESSDEENQNGKTVILVPIDFSPSSGQAAELGVNIAHLADGRLVLVHAVHLNLNPNGPLPLAQIKEELSQKARAQLELIMAKARANGVPATGIVEHGEPAKIITRAARRWEADLIVLAARKRGFLARCLGRSTAERVIQEVECPVFVLPADTQQECYV